jgi:plastocyanin
MKRGIAIGVGCLAVALIAAFMSGRLRSNGLLESRESPEAPFSSDKMAGMTMSTSANPTIKTHDQKEAVAVVIDNFTFDPPQLTISPGTTVTWINRDDVPHTATSTAKPKLFDSGPLDTDDKYSHVFRNSGTYEYFCAVHPRMTAQIIVK